MSASVERESYDDGVAVGEVEPEPVLFSFDPGQVATASGRVYYCHESRGICLVQEIALPRPYLARLLLCPISRTSLQVDNFRRLDFTEFTRLGFAVEFVFPQERMPQLKQQQYYSPPPKRTFARKRKTPKQDVDEDYEEEEQETVILEDDGQFTVPSPSTGFENVTPSFVVSTPVSPGKSRIRRPFIRTAQQRPKLEALYDSPSSEKRPYPKGVKRPRVKGPVKCKHCDKVFRNMSTMRRHSVIHTGEKKYSCEQCGKTFKWQSDHRKHMKMHEGSLSWFVCKTCNKAFDCRSRLVRHEVVHSSEKPYSCEICGQTFKHQEHVRKHKLYFHEGGPQGEKAFVCDEQGCRRAFTTETRLNRHKLSHSDERTFECQDCPSTFKYPTDLTRHIRISHSDDPDDRPFKCHECGKAFDINSRLLRHLVTHSEDRPHMCAICGKRFKLIDDLRKHERIMHEESSDSTKVPCELCPKSFLNQSHLQRHMNVHSDERPHECDLCGRTFKWSGDLRKHKLKHYEEEEDGQLDESTASGLSASASETSVNRVKRSRLRSDQMTPENLTCKYCGMLFKNRGVLNRHVVKHTGERKHLCDLCGKSFRYRSDFNQHNKMHTGDIPTYPCETCNKSFTSRTKLQRHYVVHSDDKPYPCLYCRSAFKTLDDLKRHQKGHEKRGDLNESVKRDTSEADEPTSSSRLRGRPRISSDQFECDQCELTFNYATQLRKHTKQAHSENDDQKQDFTCTQCDVKFDTSIQLNLHAKQEHNASQTRVCDECGEIFTSDRQFRSHRRNVHETKIQVIEEEDMGDIRDDEVD